MKVIAPFLALVLCAATVSGQDLASRSTDSAFLLAQAGAPSRRDAATAPDRNTAVVRPSTPAPADDSFSIPGSPARPAPDSASASVMNLWELVVSGGWAMIPLGLMSVLTVMLVLVYLFTLRRSAILTPHYMNTADLLLKKKDYAGLLSISSRHSEVVARIVQRALDFATKNPSAPFETIRDIAETEGGSQAASLQHRVTYLADIGVLAPMVGLLGTVVGIIRSFGVLGSGNTTQSRDILLASGVSEALVATATGLILGIIAMAFYGIFRNRVNSLISDMEIASAHILGLLAMNHTKKREPSRVVIEDDF